MVLTVVETKIMRMLKKLGSIKWFSGGLKRFWQTSDVSSEGRCFTKTVCSDLLKMVTSTKYIIVWRKGYFENIVFMTDTSSGMEPEVVKFRNYSQVTGFEVTRVMKNSVGEVFSSWLQSTAGVFLRMHENLFVLMCFVDLEEDCAGPFEVSCSASRTGILKYKSWRYHTQIYIFERVKGPSIIMGQGTSHKTVIFKTKCIFD